MPTPPKLIIDYVNQWISGLRVESLTSDPVLGNGGRLWFRSDLNQLKYYDGTNIRTLLALSPDNTTQIQTDQGVSFTDSAGEEGVLRRILRGSTADANPVSLETSATDVGTITIQDNSIGAFVVCVSGRCTGGSGGNSGQAIMKRIEFVATASGGVASILGQPLHTIIVNQRDGIWDVSISTLLNQVKIIVVGDTSDSITWRGWIDQTTI